MKNDEYLLKNLGSIKGVIIVGFNRSLLTGITLPEFLSSFLELSSSSFFLFSFCWFCWSVIWDIGGLSIWLFVFDDDICKLTFGLGVTWLLFFVSGALKTEDFLEWSLLLICPSAFWAFRIQSFFLCLMSFLSVGWASLSLGLLFSLFWALLVSLSSCVSLLIST